MAVAQTTPREYQLFHCAILSFLTYGRMFRPGLFPYECSISHEYYPTNRIPYDWFIPQEFVSLTNVILYDCFVPPEFVSSTNGCLNAFHCERSFLCECVFLCENVPFRNAFYSAKMFPFVM